MTGAAELSLAAVRLMPCPDARGARHESLRGAGRQSEFVERCVEHRSSDESRDAMTRVE
jgi:hypothetical protein